MPSSPPSALSTSQRRFWLAIGAMSLLFALYGSLFPFALKDVSPERAVSRFSRVLIAPRPMRFSPTDLIANVCLFVPVGFGFAGAMPFRTRSPQRRFWPPLLVLPLSFAASVSLEFLQVFTRHRIPSRLDVAAQTAGCFIGLLIWQHRGGQITRLLTDEFTRLRQDPVARLIAVYALAWMVINTAPFDLTVDVGDLRHRWRIGRIAIWAPGLDSPSGPAAWRVALIAGTSLPLGLLGRIRGSGTAFDRVTVLFPVLLAMAVETLQIIVASRWASVTDLVASCLGAVLGLTVWLAARRGTLRFRS